MGGKDDYLSSILQISFEIGLLGQFQDLGRSYSSTSDRASSS